MHSTNDNSTRRGIDSQAVHAGRQDLRGLGVHVPPLDFSTTYPLTGLDEGTASLLAQAEGGKPQGSPVYARLHNPTVARFEDALAALEQADEAIAFSSGMAALTACLLAVKAKGAGTHVVAVRPLYGGSDHLLCSGLLGLEVTFAEAHAVKQALRKDTALVVIETPANPTLQLVDIAQVVAQAGKVPVVVDSTFATPALQTPISQGAAMVLHSATKFLGGHGDVVAGVVATNAEWARELRKVRVITGAILHPLGGYLLHRGLQTLPLRVRAAQEGAQLISEKLAAHPDVAAVHFPGLPGQDRGLVGPGKQMRGPGALIAFELRGGYEAAATVMQRTELFTPAVSLGSVDSLIQHPAGLTHRVVDPEALAAHGICPGMLRASIGIETPADLWADLQAAIEFAHRAPRAVARTA